MGNTDNNRMVEGKYSIIEEIKEIIKKTDNKQMHPHAAVLYSYILKAL